MPDISNFQFIWEKWITPLVYDIFQQVDSEFVKRTRFKVRDLDELEKKAEKYFLQRRRLLKSEYYGKDDLSVVRLMDFHKLSSIICRTLIEYKVFEFDINACNQIANKKDKTDTDWLVKNALANYRLAFFSSVVFLYQSMIFLSDKDKDSEDERFINKKLKENKKLDLYSDCYTNNKRVHESFENCIVLNLAKRDINGRSSDLLMYATIMYQLEKYNRSLILNNLI